MSDGRSRWRVISGQRVMWGGLTVAVVLVAIAVAVVATGGGGDESQVAEIDSSNVTESTSASTADMATSSTAGGTSAPAQPDGQPTSTVAERPASSPSVEEVGVLSRQDQAPPGIDQQFGYVETGDPPCSAYVGQENPTVGFEREQAFVLVYFDVCIAGFDMTAPIEVTVVASDGSAVPVPPTDRPYEGVVSISFIPDLMAPTGEWTATAVQGELTASEPFRVVEPDVGTVRVVPDSGTSGSAFRLELAGFAPRHPATVDIYRSDDEAMRYVTSLEIFPTDELGRAEYSLVTRRNDPPGAYCFVGRGTGRSCPAQSWLHLD